MYGTINSHFTIIFYITILIACKTLTIANIDTQTSKASTRILNELLCFALSSNESMRTICLSVILIESE